MLYKDLTRMVKKAVDKETLVVNVRTTPCEVLVGGKKSKWRLPDYLKRAALAEKKHDVMMGYKLYLERRFKDNPSFKEQLKKELKGKILGCFCKPGLCHADILVDFANE